MMHDIDAWMSELAVSVFASRQTCVLYTGFSMKAESQKQALDTRSLTWSAAPIPVA
jgi:hypothetical protein